jgi:hypothetical protein
MDGDDPTSTYLEARVLPYEDSLAWYTSYFG